MPTFDFASDASWAPDGKRIVFSGTTDASIEPVTLHTMNQAGRG
jgi:hypothetical protein